MKNGNTHETLIKTNCAECREARSRLPKPAGDSRRFVLQPWPKNRIRGIRLIRGLYVSSFRPHAGLGHPCNLRSFVIWLSTSGGKAAPGLIRVLSSVRCDANHGSNIG